MILVKTEAGLQVLKDRSVRLTPRQRAAFILFDGRRDVMAVLQASQAGQEEVDALIGLGLLGRPAPAPVSAPPPVPADPPAIGKAGPSAADVPGTRLAGGRSAQQRYQEAYPVATRLTADLGLRGFGLNLAVEAATNCEQLEKLVPKIRAALGPERVRALEQALAR